MPAARTSGCSTPSMTRASIIPKPIMPPWGGHGVFTDDEINDMVAFLKTLKAPAVFKTNARRSGEASGAGREARQSRRDRKSRHVGDRQGAGALEAEELDRLLLQYLPQRAERDVQDLGGLDAEMGAAAQQGAGRRGIRHAPHQGNHGRGLADGDRREPRNVGLSAQSRQRRADRGRHHQRGIESGDRARQGARQPQARRTQLRLHRLPRQSGQSLDPRAVAGRAEGPVRPLPDLAHQPAGDLGHPPALPVVPGQHPRRRAAARRQGIWRSRAVSRVAERRAEAERAGDQATNQ